MPKWQGRKAEYNAIEAHPKNAKLLRANVKINGFKSVVVSQLAVSDGSTDKVKLYPGRSDYSAEWNIMGHDINGKIKEAIMEVPAISMDSYFPEGTRIDFIKIDIEGAEIHALKGMRRILRKERPLVLIEFHREVGWAGRFELFESNYRLYDIIAKRWLDPGHDTGVVHRCLAVPEGKEWGPG